MNSKLNISKWVFLALALVTVVIAVMFYLVVGTIKPQFDLGNPTPRADLFLNWGYILIILGIVIAFAIIAVVAYFMAKGSFAKPYPAGEITYSGKTHGWVELGLNFFYITLGVALLSILFSVIYKAVKK